MKQEIIIGEPREVKGRLLVKIPKESLGPNKPKEDEYREYNKYAGKIYWRTVWLSQQ
tara:strand:+ start:1587 stop:1757 length:171 start_codon:yes stop_codon:yes gene_type:complete